MNVRKRTWEIVSIAKPGDRVSSAIDVFLVALICLNVLAVILESIGALEQRFGAIFSAFEVASILIFTVEYLARLYACVEAPQYAHPVRGRLRWMFSPMALVDAVAVLPFYLPFVGTDLRFMRVFRLLRIFRIAKVARYSTSLRLVWRVAATKREEMIIAAVLMSVLIVTASCLMYFAEHQAQPEKFSSIPATMWWSIATLTTVGYGDVYPITDLGKTLAGFVAIIGIGFFALPTAILGAGFVQELQRKREVQSRVCPHCGKRLDAEQTSAARPETYNS
jgi:voltage-gated potassium channel